MNIQTARQYFYQEIQQSDEHIDLAKAALYIAQEEYPKLDPEEYLNALDTMAWELQERLPDSRYPLRMVQSLNQYLYEDLKFSGNKIDYYDPTLVSHSIDPSSPNATRRILTLMRSDEY